MRNRHAERLGLILGADRLHDMRRTTVNATGDPVIAALVDEQARNSPNT